MSEQRSLATKSSQSFLWFWAGLSLGILVGWLLWLRQYASKEQEAGEGGQADGSAVAGIAAAPAVVTPPSVAATAAEIGLDQAQAQPDRSTALELALELAGTRTAAAGSREPGLSQGEGRGEAARDDVAAAGAETACPQDLSAVRGVGRVLEQRLYAAGIGSYWELAQTPEERLASIFELREFQAVDLAAIKAEALRLAEESGAVGRAWSGQEPDDLEQIEGLGATYERRLYAAGICTFAALAAATAEELAAICAAPAFRQPDYAGWIAQARALQ